MPDSTKFIEKKERWRWVVVLGWWGRGMGGGVPELQRSREIAEECK